MRKNHEPIALQIIRQCPRFADCDVPICPLDLYQEYRDYILGEPKCTLSRAKRMAIAEGLDLPRHGLTAKEWVAYQRWHAMDETERASKLTKLRAISPFCMRNSETKISNLIARHPRPKSRSYSDKS